MKRFAVTFSDGKRIEGFECENITVLVNEFGKSARTDGYIVIEGGGLAYSAKQVVKVEEDLG